MKIKTKQSKSIQNGGANSEEQGKCANVGNNDGNNSNGTTSGSVGNEAIRKLLPFPSIQFFSLLGPYALIAFFLFLSLFNLNIKGIMYLIGLIVVLLFSNILNTFLPLSWLGDDKSKAICSVFGVKQLLDNKVQTPGLPFGTIVYSYTFFYLLIPMIQNSMMNYAVVMALLLLLGVDILIQIQSGCTNFPLIIMSIILTTCITIIWVGFILGSYMPNVTYHTDYLSNKEVCSMPSQQKFKCNVYKNGELISSMTK